MPSRYPACGVSTWPPSGSSRLASVPRGSSSGPGSGAVCNRSGRKRTIQSKARPPRPRTAVSASSTSARQRARERSWRAHFHRPWTSPCHQASSSYADASCITSSSLASSRSSTCATWAESGCSPGQRAAARMLRRSASMRAASPSEEPMPGCAARTKTRARGCPSSRSRLLSQEAAEVPGAGARGHNAAKSCLAITRSLLPDIDLGCPTTHTAKVSGTCRKGTPKSNGAGTAGMGSSAGRHVPGGAAAITKPMLRHTSSANSRPWLLQPEDIGAFSASSPRAPASVRSSKARRRRSFTSRMPTARTQELPFRVGMRAWSANHSSASAQGPGAGAGVVPISQATALSAFLAASVARLRSDAG
mmetsp:Transcript_50477/g.144299  ORF Transcript_50477/g.144299 Transcript_50477/m.144299 type:complete len:362 (+) Transcript_50477:391-1476(+)